jgi:hypothetical protein
MYRSFLDYEPDTGTLTQLLHVFHYKVDQHFHEVHLVSEIDYIKRLGK